MKRWSNPFSAGVYSGLLALFAIAGVTMFWASHVLALSNSGPDSADFATTKAYYTLSNTDDVKNTSSTGLVLYHAGAAPTGNVTVTVQYQGGGGQCLNQNYQGNAGAHFSYGVGGGYRQTSLSIPAGAWVSNGVGYTVDITANIVNGTNSCNGGGDGNHVNFKLVAPGGYIIGPDSAKNFGVAQGSYCVTYTGNPSPRSCNGYGTYNIPFGPPCTVTTNGSAAVKLYDMDNGGHPVIQPTPAVVKVIDTTTGATVNNNSYSGSEANGSTATFSFNYIAQHNYKLQISNLNLNNVLQIQLPWDSVNAQINCAPKGGITTGTTAGCTAIQGWMYDPDSPGTQLQYYVATNPASAPTTLSGPGSSANFAGPLAANQANPAGTPGGTSANHGFKVNIPANVTGHGYAGAWVTNTYYIYAKDATGSTLTRVASLTVPQGTCASVSCGTTTFALQAVGEPVAFTVNMKVNGGATNLPPGPPTFTVTVTGSGGGTNNQTFTGVHGNTPSGGYIYSDPVTFTPTGAGTYNVTWSYFGTGGCGGAAQQAAYVPYMQSLGGDAAAGPGFGNACTETTAKIESWNLNTDFTPNYYGAGSEIGAWATGNLTDFVSGMGLTGGAASQAGHGLSFANTVNTSGDNYGGQFGVNSVPCLPDFYGTKPAGAASLGSTNMGSLAGVTSGSYTAPTDGTGTFTLGSGGDIVLGQDAAGNGKQITIYVDGDLYINSNILYSYSSIFQIPRLNLYVKGNIYVDPDVTEIHGVYVAQKAATGGDINTCSPGTTGSSQSYGTCNKQLKIVGAMAAQGQMQLMRTYGNLVAATGVTNQPAEVFQYSPELWLAEPVDGGFQYQSYTSLPPVL
jgi:hypothetical protein